MRSMIAPYGTVDAASIGATTAATSASGSGYGTSSGAKRSTTDASHTISPPPRIVSTSELPSSRWLLIESERPDVKKTSSALAGTAEHTSDARATMDASAMVLARGIWLARIQERVKHTDAELTRVLAVRAGNGCGHVRLIDRNLDFVHLARAELRGLDGDLAELRLLRRQ